MKQAALLVALFVGALVAVDTALGAPPTRTALCKTFAKQLESDPPAPLPEKNLSTSEKETIKITRACLKSYSSNFPGGEKEFIKAQPLMLLRDLSLVEQLFQVTPVGTKIDSDDPQWQRRYEISRGWDKHQVLLWGNFFYVRALYKSGDYTAVLSRIAQIRKIYNLALVAPTTWDSAEKATYFSIPTLNNILISIEYAARVKLASADELPKIAADYQDARPILVHYFRFGVDATEEIFERYCN